MCDPDYIKYLLNPDLSYDCYFVVGNPELSTPVEKIGVVKKMLLAHSVVLRTELLESKMAEKNSVSVIDIYPDTFKNMLRYVYGYDTTAEMSFDDADNLLYAAEKYMICSLKDKVARRLMDMLDYSNICNLMNNPACFRVLELNSEINKILQYETARVLASPQFPGLSPDSFLRILEQRTLNVPEVEIWRAAVEWAKNRADSEEGQVLRKELAGHLQHIRVCTLTFENLCCDVFPTNVLSCDEFKLVCLSVKSGEKQADLTAVCNEIEERPSPLIRSEPIAAKLPKIAINHLQMYSSSMRLETKDCDIELISMMFSSKSLPIHECNCTINIEKHSEASVKISFNDQVENSDFTVAISNIRKKVILIANSVYSITYTSCASYQHYVDRTGTSAFDNDHFKVYFGDNYDGCYITHATKIVYRAIEKK